MSVRLSPEERVNYMTPLLQIANKLVKNQDGPLSEIPQLGCIFSEMKNFSNLGHLHLMVKSDSTVCLVPSWDVKPEYRSKSKYFQCAGSYYILKKQYRQDCESMLSVEVSFYKRA